MGTNAEYNYIRAQGPPKFEAWKVSNYVLR